MPLGWKWRTDLVATTFSCAMAIMMMMMMSHSNSTTESKRAWNLTSPKKCSIYQLYIGISNILLWAIDEHYLRYFFSQRKITVGVNHMLKYALNERMEEKQRAKYSSINNVFFLKLHLLPLSSQSSLVTGITMRLGNAYVPQYLHQLMLCGYLNFSTFDEILGMNQKPCLVHD